MLLDLLALYTPQQSVGDNCYWIGWGAGTWGASWGCDSDGEPIVDDPIHHGGHTPPLSQYKKHRGSRRRLILREEAIRTRHRQSDEEFLLAM